MAIVVPKQNIAPLSNGSGLKRSGDNTEGLESALFNKTWWLFFNELADVPTPLTAGVNYLYPEQFGALGDGATDDTTAWIATLDAAVSTGKPIFATGAYRVSRRGAYTLPWDASTHYYVFLVTSAVTVTGNPRFLLDVTDAKVASLFVFRSVTGARLAGLQCTGTGVPASLLLYDGALALFDNCADCQVVSPSSTSMRGNTLFFQSRDCEVVRGFSSVVPSATRLNGSHFASYGCNRTTIRDCVGYGGTGDGDITHFGQGTNGRATGNRTLNCSIYVYAFGDATKAIVYNEAQGFLLDSGQEFGEIAHCYAYGYYYGVDIKTTGEGNIAHDNTMEKCKFSYVARRGEGNAPTFNTRFHNNISRPLGGNGNAAAIPGCSLTVTCCFWVQDSPGTVIENNLTEASYLFGAGEQDFISVIVGMSDATFVYTSLDGPWIRNNQFMQVMNIAGIYTYSKNAAIYATGTAIAGLQRGCITGNDIQTFEDTALTFNPVRVTYARQFDIDNNHFPLHTADQYPNISIANCSLVSIRGNTHDRAAGFITLTNCTQVSICGEKFNQGVRYAGNPVPAIYADTCTGVQVIGCMQNQTGGSDNGRLFETSASGNAHIVLANNILDILIFTSANDWYKVNGVSGSTSQDISQIGNLLNGRLQIGSVPTARTYAFRSLSGHWVVDGVVGAALAGAVSQTVSLGDPLVSYGKVLRVNLTVIQQFAATGLTSISVTVGDAGSTNTWYVAIPFDLLQAAGSFVDFIPLNACVFQTGSNPQVTVTANQNLSTNTLTGAFTVTLLWVNDTIANFTV